MERGGGWRIATDGPSFFRLPASWLGQRLGAQLTPALMLLIGAPDLLAGTAAILNSLERGRTLQGVIFLSRHEPGAILERLAALRA